MDIKLINEAIEALSLLFSETGDERISEKIKSLTDKINEIEAQEKEAPINTALEYEAGEVPYIPVSKTCSGLNTLIPASQRYETLKALENIDHAVRGVDEYVAEKLGYTNASCSKEEYKEGLQCLCNAFSAEQIDALAMAIYNIEEKGQGCIIGDQTGVGKGRSAAGIIQYAIHQGKLPIFFTEKANLFSDIYRDLIDINADSGIPIIKVDKSEIIYKRKQSASRNEIIEKIKSDIEEGEFDLDGYDPSTLLSDKASLDSAISEYRDLYYEDKVEETFRSYVNKNYENDIKGARRIVPFILNERSAKSNVLDSENNVIYQSEPNDVRNSVISSADLNGYDLVMTTYSQFGRVSSKYQFLEKLMNKGAIIIMDEAHNASGDSKSGEFLREITKKADGCVFLSATYAKRPDNMPLYAAKTCIADAGLPDDDLIAAIQSGGVALQEILSSQLTSEGQYIRRQRSYKGISVEYTYLDESQVELGRPDLNLKEEHRALVDNVNSILLSIIHFQKTYVDPAVKKLDKKASNNKSGGVDNVPAFNGVFLVVSQLLFSVKAATAAKMAVESIRNGEKPIIAFSSTMESFIQYMTNSKGESVSNGDLVKDDFSVLLRRRLTQALKYKVRGLDGSIEEEYFSPDELGNEAAEEYNSILSRIEDSNTGVSLSPIDIIIDYIEKEGYKVDEITGRTRKFKILGNGEAIVEARQNKPVKQSFNDFNNNEVDCLLINLTGATGASAHAVPTKSVPAEKVKPRRMIILQAELDINKEVQKRGRIFRTGQIYPPSYTYLISSVPAEQRYMMMLQKKLASLDANTSSNQSNSRKMLDVVDFLNKYGDEIVNQYLIENEELSTQIDISSIIESDSVKQKSLPDNFAHKVSGRVALLKTDEQDRFYEEVGARYQQYIKFLNDLGENDLEVNYVDYKAKVLGSTVEIAGNGSDSPFGGEAYNELCEVNNLKKPLNKSAVDSIIKAYLGELTVEQYTEKELRDLSNWKDSQFKNLDQKKEDAKSILINKFKESKVYLNSDNKSALMSDRILDIERELEEKFTKMYGGIEQSYNIIYNRIKFFHPGKVIAYKYNGKVNMGVFTGFRYGKALNKYAPSNVELDFQFITSLKSIKIPVSKMEDVFNVESSTKENVDSRMQEYWYQDWDSNTKAVSSDRIFANILTGNILLAYRSEKHSKGKLIEFTMADGSRRKGMLISTFSNPIQSQQPKELNVPLSRLNLSNVTPLKFSNDFKLLVRSGHFMLMINGLIGDIRYIVNNDTLKRLAINQTFTKQSSGWMAAFEFTQWDSVIAELKKLNVNAIVTQEQANELGFKPKVEAKREELIDHINEVVEGGYADLKESNDLIQVSSLLSEGQYSFLTENYNQYERQIKQLIEVVKSIPALYNGAQSYTYLKYKSPDSTTYLVSELSGTIFFGYKGGEYGRYDLSEILKDGAILDIMNIGKTDYRKATEANESVGITESAKTEDLSTDKFKHTTKGFDVFVVKMNKRFDNVEYRKLESIAKRNGGYYSSYNKGGAIPGFHFKTEESALKTIEEYVGNR